MKSALKLFVTVFFILCVIRNLEAQTYSISGTVRYSDNNEIVTSGLVKLYNTSGVLEATTNINNEGDFILWLEKYPQGDVIGIPDDEWEDFIPTGYPDKVDPALFTHINATGSITNVDIYVQRRTGGMRPGVTTTVNGIVLNNNKPVSDAIVYAMQGNEYVGFGVTNTNGEYKINNIPVGDYILIAHKVASQSEQMTVTLNEKASNNFSFNLKSKSLNITNNTPYEFALVQNYPNPFNPSTVISYSIAKEGAVSLKVYNNTGQLVQELVNANQTAGIYNIDFNAADLSSGIYFYTLSTNGFTATKKMILVK